MRNSHGFHSQLLGELRVEEKDIYENYRSIVPGNFEELLGHVIENILKEDIH